MALLALYRDLEDKEQQSSNMDRYCHRENQAFGILHTNRSLLVGLPEIGWPGNGIKQVSSCR